MFRSHILHTILAALIVSLVVLSCSSQNKTTSIGVAVPLSGDNASWGEKARDAIRLVEIQEAKSLNAKNITTQLRFEDSQGNAAGGSAAIRTLLDRDNPIAVIGGITSGETAAMVPLAIERAVVLLSPTASADALSNSGPYFFRLWPTDSFETQLFVDYLIKTIDGDVAVLYIQNEYGMGVRNTFEESFRSAGGKISLVEGYSPTETNFRPLLQKLRSQNAKRVYIAGYYKDAALIMQQASDIGAQFNFFGTTTVGDPKIIELAGDAANGLVFSELMSFDPKQNTNPLAKSFMDSFIKKYNREPGWAEAHAFDAAFLLYSAIELGARTGEDIRKYLESLVDFQGVTGPISFDEHGNIRGRRVAVKQIIDGKISLIDTLE